MTLKAGSKEERDRPAPSLRTDSASMRMRRSGNTPSSFSTAIHATGSERAPERGRVRGEGGGRVHATKSETEPERGRESRERKRERVYAFVRERGRERVHTKGSALAVPGTVTNQNQRSRLSPYKSVS